MKTLVRFFLCVPAVLITAGCSSPTIGLDTLVNGAGGEYAGEDLECASCHGPGEAYDPLTTGGSGELGKHLRHVDGRSLGCGTCHDGYSLEEGTHMNGVLDAGNAAALVVRFNGANSGGVWNTGGAGTGQCSSTACHGKDSVLWYGLDGEWTVPDECTSCHGTGSAYDPLTTGGSGEQGKHIKHVTDLGYGCVKCHKGYKEAETHVNGVLDTGNAAVVKFDGANPGGGWETGGGGQCSSTSCHGGDTVTWYETGVGWTTPAECAACHGATAGTRRQVTGAGGDFSKESHHVINYGSRNSELAATADCVVCHEMGKHMSGEVRLKDADTAGTVVVYDAGNPATLEPFCVSCHDADGAVAEGADALSPFGSANTLGVIPNSAGTKIAGYWSGSSNTHKDNGLTCMGTGGPSTGCHGDNGGINAHGSSSKGILTKKMEFQIQANESYNAEDYKLCFGCHANYPDITKEAIIGVRAGGNYDYNIMLNPPLAGGTSLVFGAPPYYNGGIKTKFIDSNYNGHAEFDKSTVQLHWFHLSMRVFGSGDVWLYRGEGTPSGCTGCHTMGTPAAPAGRKATCTACHNVHGSGTPIGMVYDELAISHDTGETKGIMGAPRNNLSATPMSCGVIECHSNVPSNANYIFNPTDE